MRSGQHGTGKRDDPFRTTDGSTTGRKRDQEHGRTSMKFRLNRQLVGVATTVALLLALVAGVALLRGRAPSAVPAAPGSSVAASQGDYRLSPPNEAEPAGASVGVTSPAPGFTDFREDRSADAPAASAPVAYCAAVYQGNEQLYRDCAASAEPGLVEDRPGQRAVPTDAEVGFREHLPSEQGAGSLPSATPDGSEDPGTACPQLAGCNR